MANSDQRKIIQEQQQANQRIVRAVQRSAQSGRFEGQVPVNERIKQIAPNERVQISPSQDPANGTDSSQSNS